MNVRKKKDNHTQAQVGQKIESEYGSSRRFGRPLVLYSHIKKRAKPKIEKGEEDEKEDSRKGIERERNSKILKDALLLSPPQFVLNCMELFSFLVHLHKS